MEGPEKVIKKKNHQIRVIGEWFLHYFMRAVIALCIVFVLYASLDNFRLMWKPGDLVEEVVFLASVKPEKIPQSFPVQTEAVRDLVDAPILPAFSLLQQDSWFGYLAQMAIDRRIQFRISADWCAAGNRACYVNSIVNCTVSGRIYIVPGFLEARIQAITEALVHELTHAQNRLERPAYYCAGTAYLSDELAAFSNSMLFHRKYTRWVLFDYFDNRGVMHDYCLYRNIQKDYAGLADDVQYPRPSNMFERDYCGMYSYAVE
ncbi:MAG: hypothetical protein V1668_04830 [Patescibacteria group bacterium]